MKKVLFSILAAFTTPEAIKAEKSLSVVGLTRALILLPAAGFVIKALIVALGG